MYLAIDANMELAEEEDCFHVFGYLKKLRQSRKGLIENVVSVTENTHSPGTHVKSMTLIGLNFIRRNNINSYTIRSKST